MLIDCASHAVTHIPFPGDDITVLITNSNVKHQLATGEYAQRRAQCESALAKLGHASWRDVTREELEDARHQLDEIEFRRARHVVTEIARTQQAAAAFRSGDRSNVGQLMYASHASLRDDYEVSCDEIDLLVDLAKAIGAGAGVLGSRMTGGGFGGCTATLVQSESADDVAQTLTANYQSATGIAPQCFTSKPSLGAHVIRGKN